MNSVSIHRPSSRRAVVAFDGDDTLWVDNRSEQDWERDFKHLAVERLPSRAMAKSFRARLAEWGFTIEAVRRALLESAQDTCGDNIPAEWLEQVEALPDLCARLDIMPVAGLGRAEDLARQGREIWIITKGDLVRQAIKLARFGRAHRFARIEIVPSKNKAAYGRILNEAGVEPPAFTMVGDSLIEDVLPPLRLGASAVHVPAGRWALVRPLERLLGGERVPAWALAQYLGLGPAPYLQRRNRDAAPLVRCRKHQPVEFLCTTPDRLAPTGLIGLRASPEVENVGAQHRSLGC